jgi:hypothetical protein
MQMRAVRTKDLEARLAKIEAEAKELRTQLETRQRYERLADETMKFCPNRGGREHEWIAVAIQQSTSEVSRDFVTQTRKVECRCVECGAKAIVETTQSY